MDIGRDVSYAFVFRAANPLFLALSRRFVRMVLDDSKYLLQLARADVLTVPESPGDWNSVTVKSPKEGIRLSVSITSGYLGSHVNLAYSRLV